MDNNSSTIVKIVSIRYNNMDELLDRKEAMLKTVANYIESDNPLYNITGDEIVATEDGYLLNIELTYNTDGSN